MKIVYCCEYCEEIMGEGDIQEESQLEDNLTEDVNRDIINLESNPIRVYRKSTCEECLATLGTDEDLRLFPSLLH
ncbi:MAG: anti-sigma-F factor Fin [Thermincolia bacterium]